MQGPFGFLKDVEVRAFLQGFSGFVCLVLWDVGLAKIQPELEWRSLRLEIVFVAKHRNRRILCLGSTGTYTMGSKPKPKTLNP